MFLRCAWSCANYGGQTIKLHPPACENWKLHGASTGLIEDSSCKRAARARGYIEMGWIPNYRGSNTGMEQKNIRLYQIISVCKVSPYPVHMHWFWFFRNVTHLKWATSSCDGSHQPNSHWSHRWWGPHINRRQVTISFLLWRFPEYAIEEIGGSAAALGDKHHWEENQEFNEVSMGVGLKRFHGPTGSGWNWGFWPQIIIWMGKMVIGPWMGVPYLKTNPYVLVLYPKLLVVRLLVTCVFSIPLSARDWL